MVTRSCGGEREGCPHPTPLMQGQEALLGCIREEIWQHRLQCALNTPEPPTSLLASEAAQMPLPNLHCFVKLWPWPPLREPHLRL